MQKDAPSPLEDLVEMQCLWLLQEEGESFVRQGRFALALKRYHQIFDVSLFRAGEEGGKLMGCAGLCRGRGRSV